MVYEKKMSEKERKELLEEAEYSASMGNWIKAGGLYGRLGKKDKVDEMAKKYKKKGNLWAAGEVYIKAGEIDKAEGLAKQAEEKGDFFIAEKLYFIIGESYHTKAREIHKKAKKKEK